MSDDPFSSTFPIRFLFLVNFLQRIFSSMWKKRRAKSNGGEVELKHVQQFGRFFWREGSLTVKSPPATPLSSRSLYAVLRGSTCSEVMCSSMRASSQQQMDWITTPTLADVRDKNNCTSGTVAFAAGYSGSSRLAFEEISTTLISSSFSSFSSSSGSVTPSVEVVEVDALVGGDIIADEETMMARCNGRYTEVTELFRATTGPFTLCLPY